MNVRRLWSHITATGLLLAAATVAGGQEASSTTTPSNPSIETTSSKFEESKSGSGQSAPATKPGTPAKPKDPLADLIEEAIRETGRRKLTAGVHTPWQVVHGILAQRWDLTLQQPGPAGGEVSGIEWITSGVYFDGMPLWEATPYGGRGHPFTRPYAFEGHPTQFMGYMTMADIPLDYEVQTPTKIITIRDIINDAKKQVHQGVEITWTLWALAHYEEPDSHWFSATGEPWSIERLVKLQVDEPVTSGACGGCHGLFVLAYARNMYMSTNKLTRKQLRGVWFEADQKIQRYIAEAKTLQNTDGSFSADHFKGPRFSDDFPTRIATSGHQLEWLMVALSQKELNQEWVRRGIAAVAKDLVNNKHVASDCGPLYHGMHALTIYRQRTVPGYLIPQFNSQVKMADRKRSGSAGKSTAAPPSSARRDNGDSRSPAIKSTPAEANRTTTAPAANSSTLLDGRAARK